MTDIRNGMKFKCLKNMSPLGKGKIYTVFHTEVNGVYNIEGTERMITSEMLNQTAFFKPIEETITNWKKVLST